MLQTLFEFKELPTNLEPTPIDCFDYIIPFELQLSALYYKTNSTLSNYYKLAVYALIKATTTFSRLFCGYPYHAQSYSNDNNQLYYYYHEVVSNPLVPESF